MSLLKLRPIGKDYLWGGERLKKEYGKDINITPLAETWECSVHPDGMSIIVGGEFDGKTLAEVVEKNPDFLGEKNKNEFPILVKFIDAAENLSVQVHPNDVYAKLNEGQNGKTEMWYILDAAADSFLIYGFEAEYSKETIRRAAENGTLMNYLHKEKVQKGDTVFIPAGTVHAIGKGLLIAEIQENSNVTYRIYDYDRIDKNGNKRELHIDKALEVMNTNKAPKLTKYSVLNNDEYSERMLCKCDCFQTNHILIKRLYESYVDSSGCEIILCIDGEGNIFSDGCEVKFGKGDCIFITSDTGRYVIKGGSELLRIKI